MNKSATLRTKKCVMYILNRARAKLEVLRLVDLEDLSQEEAGERMGVSRGTIWRLLQEARREVTQALVEGRPIRITLPQES